MWLFGIYSEEKKDQTVGKYLLIIDERNLTFTC